MLEVGEEVHEGWGLGVGFWGAGGGEEEAALVLEGLGD